ALAFKPTACLRRLPKKKFGDGRLFTRDKEGEIMKKKPCFLFLVWMLGFSVSVLAQETTGGIQGVVKDPQGALIPGATVEVTSPALIGKKTAVTDSAGAYRFDLLPPGVYSISVQAPGFAPHTQGN